MPPEYEQEVLILLERFGYFKSVAGVAEHMGVSPKALSAFLRTDRAKAAASLAAPKFRELLRKRYRTQRPDEDQDPALLDEALDGFQIFSLTDGIVSTKKTK